MRRLEQIISLFPKARVLVVGDLILDEYIWGTVERISPEAPVPVVWATRRSFVPGGAANVANNIRSFGADVRLIGVVGRDKNADTLLSELKKKGISLSGVITDSKRHTTVKTRIIAGHQQVVRVDWEDVDCLGERANREILRRIKGWLDYIDAIIIEDYGKGVINKHLLEGIFKLTRKVKKIVTVDPKEEHFKFYQGVTSITPNRKELENAVRNLRISDSTNRFKAYTDRLMTDEDIDNAAHQVMRYLRLGSLLVTLGEQGMRLFEKGLKSPQHIPAVAQEVYDVSGAGDTVIATFTLALACGADKVEAATLANFAAGIVVGKIGTAVTNREELLNRIRQG